MGWGPPGATPWPYCGVPPGGICLGDTREVDSEKGVSEKSRGRQVGDDHCWGCETLGTPTRMPTSRRGDAKISETSRPGEHHAPVHTWPTGRPLAYASAARGIGRTDCQSRAPSMRRHPPRERTGSIQKLWFPQKRAVIWGTKRFSFLFAKQARAVAMGARRLGFVTYLVTVFALVTCTFHGDAAETTDLLVTQVQDALATHASGDVDAALEKYDALTADTDSFGRLSPNAASSVLNNAGGIRYSAGDTDGAFPYWERAVRVDPTHAESLVNLALLLSEDRGEHETALRLARNAVKLRPEHAKSHHLLGNILQRLGQIPEAHLRFKTAEALASDAQAKRGGEGGDDAHSENIHKRYEAKHVGFLQSTGVSSDNLNGDEFIMLETVSVVPLVFRIRGFLTQQERETLIRLAEPEMETSRTLADEDTNIKQGSKKPPPRVSSTAWLPTRGNSVSETITNRAADVLQLDPATRFVSSERLQVLKYTQGGYFDAHHESTAFLNRFVTLLYYLDGPGAGNGGETVFPLAPDGFGGEESGAQQRERGLHDLQGNITAVCEMGARTKPIPGDAIMFFNLDEAGAVDSNAIHAACEVTNGVKWAANHWFKYPETTTRKGSKTNTDEKELR